MGAYFNLQHFQSADALNNAYANYERTQHEEQYALVKVYKNFIFRYKNTACSNGRQRKASYFASEKGVLHNLWPWSDVFKQTGIVTSIETQNPIKLNMRIQGQD